MEKKVSILCFFNLIVTLWLFTPSWLRAAAPDELEDSAVILIYHRFGQHNYPTTNVTLKQFDHHIAELSKEKYNILPLKAITEAFRKGEKLPPRTIAITIDDAFMSVYEEAWPRLKKAGLPFTLFIATAPLENNTTDYMSWDNIRTMAADPLVDIGHHGHNHKHLMLMKEEDARKDIQTASRIYEKQLGFIPKIFAYPYGEFSENLAKIIKSEGLTAGVGQHSGAANSTTEIIALPRFALNEKYAHQSRFELIVNARALPIRDLLPRFSDISNNPPVIGFTISEEIAGLEKMGCFPSHLGRAATLHKIGTNRIEIRFDQPFPKGRSRINCTMPGPEGRWYWFGIPFFNYQP